MSLSRERKVEFCLEREDGTDEKNGQREEREKERADGRGEEEEQGRERFFPKRR